MRPIFGISDIFESFVAQNPSICANEILFRFSQNCGALSRQRSPMFFSFQKKA